MGNIIKPDSRKERAIELLGAGVLAEDVARTLGVSASQVSQWMSDESFASAVSTLRYEALKKHNERDNNYDSMEDRLMKQLTQTIPLLTRPMEIARVMKIVNEAKRRGSSTPEAVTNKATTVNIVMPAQVIQRFTLNSANQVIAAGDQELLTLQSGSMDSLLAAKKEPAKEIQHDNGNGNELTFTTGTKAIAVN